MRRRAAASPRASPGAVYRRRDSPPQDGQGAVVPTDAIGILSVETPCSSQMKAQAFWGKPSSMPPWLGSSQRLVTTLPRVKKCTPSMPWAWVSPKRLFFQPPKE